MRGDALAIDDVKRLADVHRYELGFIMRPQIEMAIKRGQLLVAYVPARDLIGFSLVWHRRDGQTTLHAIAVREDMRGSGAGKMLIGGLLGDMYARGQKVLLARCPVGLPSNGFYAHLGFGCVAIEAGKNRALNVWRLELREKR
jgi:GNAT superfamily N-acetyltransferase